MGKHGYRNRYVSLKKPSESIKLDAKHELLDIIILKCHGITDIKTITHTIDNNSKSGAVDKIRYYKRNNKFVYTPVRLCHIGLDITNRAGVNTIHTSGPKKAVYKKKSYGGTIDLNKAAF